MHISKINGQYPIAFKPNNIIPRTKNPCSYLEYHLVMVLFVVPAVSFPENRTISIDVDLITDKPLKGSICSRLNEAINNAFEARFDLITDDTHFELINVFEKITREGNKITAIITQSAIDQIKKQFLNGFTKIPIEYSIKLQTAYQLIFLEYILRFEGTKMSCISIQEIKKRGGILPDKYPQWDNFNRRVVCSSITGINKRLNFNVEYDITKSGKKVIAISLSNNSKSRRRNRAAKNTADKCNNQEVFFNFASECFEILSPEEKEIYKKDLPDCIGDTVKHSTAVNNFIKQHNKLLKKSKNPEEFFKAKAEGS